LPKKDKRANPAGMTNARNTSDASQSEGDGGHMLKGPRHSVWMRVLRSLIYATALVLAIAAGAILYLIERPVVLPLWARERVENALDQSLGDLRLRFGEVTVVVQEGWRPRLRFRDVVLSEKDALAPLVTLQEFETGLSRDALFEGAFKPRVMQLTGGYLVLRRDREGVFQLSLGEALKPIGAAPTLPELIQSIDEVFSVSALERLTRIQVEGLALRFEDQLSDRAWNIDGGRLLLTRQNDAISVRADAALLGGYDYATVLEASYDSRLGAQEARFGVNFEDLAATDLADEVPALAWLSGVRAPISGSLRSATSLDGSLGPLSGTLTIGSGALQPRDDATPIPFDGARSYFTFDPKTATLRFDELSVTSKWLSGRAEGKVIIETGKSGRPEAVVGQVRLQNVKVGSDILNDDPLDIDELFMDGRLRLDPFVLNIGQLSLRENDVRGWAKGEVSAAPGGWEIALDAKIPDASSASLLPLWPRILAPKAREWVENNLLRGTFSDFQASVRSTPGGKPISALSFAFKNTSFVAVKGLPPVENASGFASLAKQRFSVTAEAGTILPPQGGALDVSGTHFIVPDVLIKGAPAEVQTQISGTVTGLLSLLDAEPLRLLQKAGQPVVLADGRLTGKARLVFPLVKGVKPDQVEVSANGQIRDVRSSILVPGRELSASTLDFRAEKNILTINGAARVGIVPIQGAVTLPLKKGEITPQVVAEVELSDRFLKEFNIALPQGSVSGRGLGRLTLALGKEDRKAFSLSSNLKGVGLSVPQIGWSFPQAQSGTFEINGELSSPPKIESVSLSAEGLSAKGQIRLTEAGELDRVNLTALKVGNWLESSVLLTGRGAGKAPAVSVTGGWIDLRKTSFGGESGSNSGKAEGDGPITLSLDKLIVSEGITLTNFAGRFETAKGFDGVFQARVNGKAPVRGQVLPQNGRTGFRITSDDAGAVFAAAGLLKKASGGELDLTMRPARQAGIYDGALRVKNIRLREAPAMAALLSAVSVVGLLEQLDGQGIPFMEVDADFHLSPTTATVLRSSAVGASIGLSMDGTYDLKSGVMNMQGVVSPLYLLNGIGSILTRKGEGLLGFNYRLEGQAANPKVFVNPLSIFTPGMFREIFRRPPPKVTQ
jgi:hypothetical protein